MQRRADRYTELKLHKSSNIGVTRDLMMCLEAGEWLNDEVINLTMGLLQVSFRGLSLGVYRGGFG